MFLFEAFKACDALNEDTFSITNDGVESLSQFMNDDDAVDTVTVIDPEAETEEELQDSYVGKVIIDCSVCHSKLYKDKSEVIIDEEDPEHCNVGDECPYCYSSDGFKVIGEVSAYNKEEAEDNKDDKDEKPETNIKSENEVKDDNLNESLNESVSIDIVKSAFDKLNKEVKEVADATGLTVYVMEPDWEEFDGENIHTINNLDLMCDETFEIEGTGVVDVIEYDIKNNEYIFDKDEIIEYLSNTLDDEEDDYYEESLNESVNNVNVDTDDATVSVSQDENGTVTVQTTPKSEVNESSSDEVITPLSPETENEITNNEIETTDEFSEVDVDVDDFDEESFDQLGESYLKNIYENIESYNTKKVTNIKNKLKVEGIITFTSGNEKPTTFLFESKEITKNGQANFIGENLNIAKGKKAFKLSGKINEGKFITESLNYNYKDSNKRIYGTVKNK